MSPNAGSGNPGHSEAVFRSVSDMRFGIDVAQQRMEWDELLTRTRLGEESGFEGAWGFDHFQPMYGEGPGNCFEGMTTLAALAASTTSIRIGLNFYWRHLPASFGSVCAGDHS